MKTLKRACPYSLWEIDAIEGWLDDMATRGYLLQDVKSRFIFLKTHPQTVRHRIDVLEDQYANSKVRREEYRDFGWEHIASLGEHLDVYRAAREDAVELNTDEELLRLALAKAQRGTKVLFLLTIALCAFALIWIAAMYIRHGIFYRLMMGSFARSIISLTLMVHSVVLMIWEFRAYRRIKRRTLLERTYHTRKREKAELRTKRLTLFAFLLILWVPFIVQISTDFGVGESVAVPDAYQIYSAPEFLPAEGSDDALDRVLHYRSGPSDQYSWSQRGGSRHVSDYAVTVYEVRWDWLARCYAEEQARLAGAEALDVAGHEGAWFYVGVPPMFAYQGYRPADKQNLVLLDGSRVVEIRYGGSADLRAAALAIN